VKEPHVLYVDSLEPDGEQPLGAAAPPAGEP